MDIKNLIFKQIERYNGLIKTAVSKFGRGR